MSYIYIESIEDVVEIHRKMEAISYHLAANRIDKDLLQEIIQSIVYYEDYSEELQIKIKNAFLAPFRGLGVEEGGS